MRQLTIYINTLPIHIKSGGIKTFLLELLSAFGEKNNKYFNYIIICSEKNKPLFEDYNQYSNFSLHIVQVDNTNIFKRIYYEQFRLSKFLNKKKDAILLNICNIAVLNCTIPQVTIIQAQYSIADLRKKLPAEYVSISPLHKLYYDSFLKRSIRISHKTIAVSDYMVQFLQEYKNKISVIHEGVNSEKFEVNKDSIAFSQYKPYILSLSTMFPHKNMNRVIEAFSKLKKESQLEYKLIIAGKDPDSKQLAFLKDIAKQNNVEKYVFFLGWVSADDITVLYQNASLFIFLSSVEFFGLPVLEAMASGIPVIAADAMSLPEVVKDAGVLVDPHNTEMIKAEIEKILTYDSWRQTLIAKGKTNVKTFTWQITAQKFEDVFLEIGRT